MRTMIKSLAALAIVLAVVVVARAEEDKKAEKVVTLKGELGCPKCVFAVKGFKKCGNAIKVKDGDKEVIYILDDNGGKESYHKKICTESAMGSVKGVVTKKDGVMYIKPAKDGVKYD